MVVEDLRRILKGEVSNEESLLNEFSKDASIFSLKPQLVVFPHDARDIQYLVQYIRAKKHAGENFSITMRAAGTDMSGGSITESIVVGVTKHLNSIKEIGEDYVLLEPGVYYRDLEKELDKRDLFYPAYPASKSLCAVGGMVANNSGGEKTLLFGKTDKYVEELKVILSDGKEYLFRCLSTEELEKKMKLETFEGEVYRRMFRLVEGNFDSIQKAKPAVSKNSAGYALWDVWDRKKFDLTKLFVGSQGTLGVITEIKLRLLKKKPHSRLVVLFLNSIKEAVDLLPEFKTVFPESIESYDKNTLKLAMRFMPDLLKNLKGGLFSLVWSFWPELIQVLKRGLPNLIVLVEVTGENPKEAEERGLGLVKHLKKMGVEARMTKTQAETDKYWAIRRESFNLLRNRVKSKATAPFVDDIIVKPELLPSFLPRLTKILDQYSGIFTYTIAGHLGDGNFHIIPLMDLDDEKARKIIPILSDEVYELIMEFKGSITAEHNDGLIRSPYLKKMFGEKIYSLFEETKNIFDPSGIFNPGKKVGSDPKFAFMHMKHMAKIESNLKK